MLLGGKDGLWCRADSESDSWVPRNPFPWGRAGRRERSSRRAEAGGPDGADAGMDRSPTVAARPVNTNPWADLAAGFRSLGFQKRAGLVFTRDVTVDVLGWLGLNRASRHSRAGEFEVNPVVGIRHQGVERMVAQLRGEKFHAYQPPTVSNPLGYLMPKARYRAWMVSADDPGASVERLIGAVEAYALPFMESGSTLTGLCKLMDAGLGFEHQLVFRHPVACALAGARDRAAVLVDATEAELGDRDDAAAVELRSFLAAFRSRFLLSSGNLPESR